MSEFSFEQLQQMRVANIQSQFVNNEELQKGEQDELEKARHGTYADTAENRRLNRVGQEYGHKAEEKQPSGQRTKKTEETSGAGGKTVADHAANTDSKVLKKVVDDPNAKPELKEAAQAELKKRGEGESKKQMTREEFVEKMRQDGVSEEDIKRFTDFEEFGDSIAEQIKQEKERKEKSVREMTRLREERKQKAKEKETKEMLKKDFKEKFGKSDNDILKRIVSGDLRASEDEKGWAKEILDERKKEEKKKLTAESVINFLKSFNSKWTDINKVVAFETKANGRYYWEMDYDGEYTDCLIPKSKFSEDDLKEIGIRIEKPQN